MTVEEARDLAHEKLVAVSKGIDPLAAEAEAAGRTTVADICDWYLTEAEAGRILGRRRRPIKASTLAMDRSRIESHLKPLLGRRQVGALKLGDIEAAQADIAAGRPRRRARAAAAVRPPAAKASPRGPSRRCMRSSSMRYVSAKSRAIPPRGSAGSPARRANDGSAAPKSERLGKTLRAAAEDGEHPTGLAAIRFLLLTGFRRMEGLGVERTWLDEVGGRDPFPRYEERRSDPRDRSGPHRSPARSTRDEVVVLLPGRLGRGAFHWRRSGARPYLRTRSPCRHHAAHAAPHIREPRRRPRLFRTDHRRAIRPCFAWRHPALHPYRRGRCGWRRIGSPTRWPISSMGGRRSRVRADAARANRRKLRKLPMGCRKRRLNRRCLRVALKRVNQLHARGR